MGFSVFSLTSLSRSCIVFISARALIARYNGFNCIYRTKGKVSLFLSFFGTDVEIFANRQGAFRVFDFSRAFRKVFSCALQKFMFITFVNQKTFEMTCVRRKRYLNEVVQWGFKKRKLEKVAEKVCDSCDGISVLALEITCRHFQPSKDMLQRNKEN